MFPISDSIPAKRFPFITLALILVTVFVFFQQLTTPDPDGFIVKYALIPSLINFNNSETFYPFVTAIFLHGGFLHILSNMWFLWVFGDNVEGYFGWFFYPLLYFASGVAGNALQYILMPTSSMPILGASGAIAGVLGGYFVLFPHARIKTLVPFFGFFTLVNIPAILMLGYWFVLQFFSGAFSLGSTNDMGGVAFWAHVGGFMTGVLFGLFIKIIKTDVSYE